MEEIEFDAISQVQGGETQPLKVNYLFQFLINYKNVYIIYRLHIIDSPNIYMHFYV